MAAVLKFSCDVFGKSQKNYFSIRQTFGKCCKRPQCDPVKASATWRFLAFLPGVTGAEFVCGWLPFLSPTSVENIHCTSSFHQPPTFVNTSSALTKSDKINDETYLPLKRLSHSQDELTQRSSPLHDLWHGGPMCTSSMAKLEPMPPFCHQRMFDRLCPTDTIKQVVFSYYQK